MACHKRCLRQAHSGEYSVRYISPKRIHMRDICINRETYDKSLTPQPTTTRTDPASKTTSTNGDSGYASTKQSTPSKSSSTKEESAAKSPSTPRPPPPGVWTPERFKQWLESSPNLPRRKHKVKQRPHVKTEAPPPSVNERASGGLTNSDFGQPPSRSEARMMAQRARDRQELEKQSISHLMFPHDDVGVPPSCLSSTYWCELVY